MLRLLGNDLLVFRGYFAAFTYYSMFSGLVSGFTHLGERFTYLGEFSGLLGCRLRIFTVGWYVVRWFSSCSTTPAERPSLNQNKRRTVELLH